MLLPTNTKPTSASAHACGGTNTAQHDTTGDNMGHVQHSTAFHAAAQYGLDKLRRA
jgi:hypothetical protein